MQNGENNRKSYQVHRLVAEAFIPNLNNYPVINHIDENRKNNYVENLEWCTQKHNVLHSIKKMCKPKNILTVSKSNEKYIYKRERFNKIYYEVSLTSNHKRYYLGKYNDIKEAVLARDKFIKNNMSELTNFKNFL